MKQNLGWVTAAPLFAPAWPTLQQRNTRPCNRTSPASFCFISAEAYLLTQLQKTDNLKDIIF